jgi:hypothetical protein
MSVSLLSPKARRTGVAVITILATGIFLSACSKANTPASTTGNISPQSQNIEESTGSTAKVVPPGASTPPMVKAGTTDQAAMSEGAELNKLNDSAANIDKSLNDKAIDVNQ